MGVVGMSVWVEPELEEVGGVSDDEGWVGSVCCVVGLVEGVVGCV